MEKIYILVAVLGATVSLLEKFLKILRLLREIMNVFKRKKDAATRQK